MAQSGVEAANTGLVIVGGGQAAASCAARYRAKGGAGPVAIYCAEPVPPYQRPPLSKAYLLGDMPLSRLLLRPESWYEEQAITLHLGTRIEAIDTDARTITTQAGDQAGYGHLVLATGSAPRQLPAAIGGDLAGVHVVRDLADVDRMAGGLREGARAVIIGGGYIGLEAAAVCAKLGLDVTVLEAAPRILGRVAAAETADVIRDLHVGNGVTVREGCQVAHLRGADGHVTGVTLASGETLEAEVVIVGIGIAPETALAEAAGIAVDNGIATDSHGRTSAPHVWSAGDCASFPFRGAQMRLESVQNAIDQAECVADNILGADTPYDPKPWFWSDQFDMKLQIAGLNAGHDSLHVRAGEGLTRSHWYYRDGRLISVDAINDPRAYMVGKRLIEGGRTPDPAQVVDPSTDLKALMKTV